MNHTRASRYLWSLALATVLLFAGCVQPDSICAQPVPGMPVLVTPNGTAYSRVLFAGAAGQGRPIDIGAEWQEIRYTLIAPRDDAEAFVQINIGSQHGKLQICDFVLTSDNGQRILLSTPFTTAAWTQDWQLIDSQKAGVTSRLEADGLEITVPKRMEFPWFVQLCSRRLAIDAGSTYTVSFRLRAQAASAWPVTSYLMRLNPLCFYGASGEDQFFATAAQALQPGQSPALLSPLVPMPWPEDAADYDRELAVTASYLDRIVADHPDAGLILRIGVEPPVWWRKAHTDELLRWENGQTDSYVCVASEVWRQDVRTHLAQLIPRLEQRWGDHIAAYAPVAQNTGEWYYPIWQHDTWGSMNFSAAFRSGYQLFLQQRYGTITRLNQAWDSAFTDFAAIAVPSGATRHKALLPPFRDPARQRNLFDFGDYQQTAMREALESAARAIKAAAGPAKPVIAFYGYTLELAGCKEGIGETGHLQLGQLLRSPDLDGVVDIVSYFDRGVKGTGCLMMPTESVTSHGKLLFTEDDSRTWLSAVNAGYERTTTADETRWALSRNLARSLVHRGYLWEFDLYGAGWFNDAPLWQHLSRLAEAGEARPSQPLHSDVAVIVDEKSFLALEPGTALTRPLVYDFRSAISRSGLGTPSWWLLDDVMAGRVPPHRLTIFLNAFYLTASERTVLTAACRKWGGAVLWLYAPGYLGNQGEDIAGMRDLTGFQFTRFTLPPKSSRLVKLVSGASLALPDGVDTYFSAAPDDGDVLGTFADGQIALARSQASGYTSVFCAAPRVSPELLADLGRAAGAWCYTEPGQIVITDGRLLSITSPAGGDVAISLPGKCRVVTADGALISVDADHLVLPFLPGETRAFVLSQP